MKDDPLLTTPPEGIPGALFTQLTRVLLDEYKPGTIISTASGAGLRAERTALKVIETTIGFYEAVAAEEDNRA